MSPILLALIFTSATNEFDLPPNLLSSICYIESTHNAGAIHYNDGDGNSVGICQIKFKTAKWLGYKGTEKLLLDPKVNIHYSAKYLRYQLNRYGGNIVKAVSAYNKGNAKKLTNTTYYNKVVIRWIGNKRRLAYENQ